MPQSCRRHHWMGKIPIKNETNQKTSNPKSIKKSWNIQHNIQMDTSQIPLKNPPGSYSKSNEKILEHPIRQRHARLVFWHQSAQAAWEASSIKRPCRTFQRDPTGNSTVCYGQWSIYIYIYIWFWQLLNMMVFSYVKLPVRIIAFLKKKKNCLYPLPNNLPLTAPLGGPMMIERLWNLNLCPMVSHCLQDKFGQIGVAHQYTNDKLRWLRKICHL